MSGNEEDVNGANSDGHPAGLVIKSDYIDNDDPELRLAFDFDAALADDEAETIYKESGSLDDFRRHEVAHKEEVMQTGPLKEFIDKVTFFQKLES